MSAFKKAVRTAARLRIGLSGPSGAGKTYTALRIAHQLGQRVAVIDTERGSASLYQGESPDGKPFEFDVLELQSFAPGKYQEAIRAAVAEKYDVLVIDSLSHAWNGTDGMLAQVDKIAAKDERNKNSFGAWRTVTPQHNALVESILTAPLHVILTLRTKTEWVLERDDRGKQVPRRIGLTPVFRDGLEYECTVFLDIDVDHTVRVTKTRCSAIADSVYQKPGPELARPLLEWLSGAAPEPPSPPTPVATTPPAVTPASTRDRLAALGLDVPTLETWLAATEKKPIDERSEQELSSLVSALAVGTGPRKAFEQWAIAQAQAGGQPAVGK